MAGIEVIDGPVCAVDGSCCGPDSSCCHEFDGPVDIRRAQASDLDSVRTLLAQSNLPLDGVTDCIDQFFVAEAGGSVVGSIGMETYDGGALLRSAAVSKPLQGRGIGRRLIDQLIADAKGKGISAMYLLTTTAENYFPSFGFEKIDRALVPSALEASAELQGTCPSTATVMKKELR